MDSSLLMSGATNDQPTTAQLQKSRWRVAHCVVVVQSIFMVCWLLIILDRRDLVSEALVSAIGPDRLELIIFGITGKKIDNDPSRLIIIISFILDFFFYNLLCYMTLDVGSALKWSSCHPNSFNLPQYLVVVGAQTQHKHNKRALLPWLLACCTVL